ncbi:MAG: hypothetical protein LBL34_01785 [Clostridiales bacterium]|jgi:hypothetical protein|nr:hypothetical protein [Clostridiales bacterium]
MLQENKIKKLLSKCDAAIEASFVDYISSKDPKKEENLMTQLHNAMKNGKKFQSFPLESRLVIGEALSLHAMKKGKKFRYCERFNDCSVKNPPTFEEYLTACTLLLKVKTRVKYTLDTQLRAMQTFENFHAHQHGRTPNKLYVTGNGWENRKDFLLCQQDSNNIIVNYNVFFTDDDFFEHLEHECVHADQNSQVHSESSRVISSEYETKIWSEEFNNYYSTGWGYRSQAIERDAYMRSRAFKAEYKNCLLLRDGKIAFGERNFPIKPQFHRTYNQLFKNKEKVIKEKDAAMLFLANPTAWKYANASSRLKTLQALENFSAMLYRRGSRTVKNARNTLLSGSHDMFSTIARKLREHRNKIMYIDVSLPDSVKTAKAFAASCMEATQYSAVFEGATAAHSPEKIRAWKGCFENYISEMIRPADYYNTALGADQLAAINDFYDKIANLQSKRALAEVKTDASERRQIPISTYTRRLR